MLEELTIKNYALIDSITVRFSDGLNILSGETGAGKSILVGALGLLLGMKAETTAIRTGADEASVSGIIRVDGNREALAWLSAHDIEPEDGTVIIRRSLKQSGRGAIYIQSAPVTRADLSELTGTLFDMHGQHEHQSLLQVENHRKLLDQYGGLEPQVTELYRDFLALSALKKQYEKLTASERERAREIEMLQYAVSEIEKAAPVAGEEEELLEERRILSQYEKLFALLEEFHELMSSGRGGCLGSLRSSVSTMESISAIDPKLSANVQRLENAFFEIEDVADTVRQYQLGLNFRPQRLEEVEERLAELRRLEKKYGDTIEAVLAYADDARQKLTLMENWDEEKAALEQRIAEAEKAVLAAAQEISRRRRKAAVELQQCIESNLQELGMPKARFVIGVHQRESESGRPLCGPYGLDSVEFEISPNKGEPLKPLKDIVSGGEISRIMLAIKTVLAETDDIGTLIFDEIDTGIGGEIAVSVGEHLYNLSRHKQVLCITHLATIAVRADTHVKVEKAVVGDRTATQVRIIGGQEKVVEIARMLSGDKSGEIALNHAEEMLRKYSSL